MHNPAGVDPTEEQWHKIAQVMKENDLFPSCDVVYQGLASRCLNKDGSQMVVAQSFAETMSLYG